MKKNIGFFLVLLACNQTANSQEIFPGTSNANLAATCANAFLTMSGRYPKNSADWNVLHQRGVQFMNKASQLGGPPAMLAMADGIQDIAASLKKDPSLYKSQIIPFAETCNKIAPKLGL